MSGITITCFAASYAVAWMLEFSRLLFRSGVRGVVMVLFGAAGMLAHTLFLAYRVAEIPTAPLSSSFDWCLVAAWLLAGAYLYLTYQYPRAVIGLFILPLVLALIGAAAMLADRRPLAPEGAWRAWGAIHGVFLLLGTVTVMVGFVAGLMYLIQSMRLKRKLPPMQRFRFPSLERLEKVNSRVILLSALWIALGFLAGIILKLVDRGGMGLPWSDPVVWSSGLMLAWLVAAAIFNLVYKPARQGRKVAYLTVVSFLFLLLALGVFLLVDSAHAGSRFHGRSARSTAYRLVGPAWKLVPRCFPHEVHRTAQAHGPSRGGV